MKVVKVKILRSNSFWIFHNIHLGPKNPISEAFDLDSCPEVIRHSIERSEKMGIIRIMPQAEDIKASFEIEKPHVGVFNLPQRKEFEKAKKELTRQAFQYGDEESKKEIKKIEPSDEDFSKAETFLNQNGNSVKKQLRESDSLTKEYLLACLKVEKDLKNRKGIVDLLEDLYLGLED